MQRTRRGLSGVSAAAIGGHSGCLALAGVECIDAAAEDPPDADIGGDSVDGWGGGESNGDEDRGPTHRGPTRLHRLSHYEAEDERCGFDEHAGVQFGRAVQPSGFALAAGFSGDAWEEPTDRQGQSAKGWVAV